MSKRTKSVIISWVVVIFLLVTQVGYYIYHAIQYKHRVDEGNARWEQVEDRIVTVENRLDKIENRVDKIEKGL